MFSIIFTHYNYYCYNYSFCNAFLITLHVLVFLFYNHCLLLLQLIVSNKVDSDGTEDNAITLSLLILSLLSLLLLLLLTLYLSLPIATDTVGEDIVVTVATASLFTDVTVNHFTVNGNMPAQAS